MSVFVLKLIAIITMLIDHMGIIIYGSYFSWMRCVGRIAFPIFAFLIAEGYCHTKNIKKYTLRLLVFSLVSQVPFYLFNKPREDYWYLNVGFTLLLGVISIMVYKQGCKVLKKYEMDKSLSFVCKLLTYFIIFFIATIGFAINSDYGGFGVIMIFLFYLFREKKTLRNIAFIFLILLKYSDKIIHWTLTYKTVLYIVFYILSLILINFYNGKKGYSSKWLFYLVYPVHLLIFALIDIFI